MKLTDYVKKAIVGTAIAASAMVGAPQTQAASPTHPQSLSEMAAKGGVVITSADFNKDGLRDDFVCRPTKTEKGYSFDCFYRLAYKDKYGGQELSFDPIEKTNLPEGTCADFTMVVNKLNKSLNVGLFSFPCENYDTTRQTWSSQEGQKALAYFVNDGTGHFTRK